MALNPYDISSIYSDMELDLVKSMKQNMKLHESEELKEGFKWEQWQKTKLREIKKFQKRNKGIIKDYQKIIDGETDKLLKSSFKNGSKRSENFISKTLNKVSSKFKNMFEPKEKSFFKINEDKVFSLIKSVKGDLHNANHAALRKMDDIYRQTIFKSQMYVVNGAMTVNQAVDMATKDFLDKGINCITYKNGRKVNISSYAEMSIRTANQRVTLMGEGIKRDEYGVHTVITSNHTNTCPLCLPWQGRVLIDDVYSKGSSKEGRYPLLSEAMAIGFLHPNCRHHPTTFFPGINEIPKPLTEEEKQDALKKYNAEQKQREIERNIRKWKRIEAGNLDIVNIEDAHKKLELYQNQMKEHLLKHSYLRRDSWREKLRNDDIISTSKYLDSRNNKLKQVLSKELEKLTNDEKEVIRYYTGFGANKINSALTTGKGMEALRDKIDVLDKALAKGVINENIIVYRKTIPEYLGIFPKGYKVTDLDMIFVKNRVIEAKSFTSTSLNDFDYQGRNVFIRMKVSKGYKGALYIKNVAIDKYKYQEEVLFSRDLKYIIDDVKIDNNKYYLDAEVIE